MRSFFKKSLFSLNILASLFLFAAVGAKYISPADVWWLSFLGMLFPLFVVVHLVFILVWLSLRKKQIFLSILSLLSVTPSIEATFSFFHKTPAPIAGKKVKLMSYNVKNFDLYNWTGNLATRKKILQMIADENPDIICFQEFYNQDTLSFRNRIYFTDTLGYAFSYFKETVTHHSLIAKGSDTRIARKWGVAIFSRFPITDTGYVAFDNAFSNSCCWADVLIENQKTRIYSLHLQSIRFGAADYLTLQEIELNRSANWWDIKAILKKFKNASAKRAAQVEQIKNSLATNKLPAIVCGDFNDLPISYSTHQIGNGLQDAFVHSGKGFGATFVNKLPFFRIDHLFFDPSFAIQNYAALPYDYSDHYPVVVEFGIQKP